MSYIVIEEFAHKTDGHHAYKPGMVFPREGLDVTEARIKELSTAENALRKPLIREDEGAKTEKPQKTQSKKTKKSKE